MASIGNNSSVVLSHYWESHSKLKEYFLDYSFFFNWMHTPSAIMRSVEDEGRTPWTIFIREDESFILEYLESSNCTSLYSAKSIFELSDDQLLKTIWSSEYEITWLGPKFQWSFEKYKKWMTTKGSLDKELMLPWNIEDGVEYIGLSPLEMCKSDGYIILDIFANDVDLLNKNLKKVQSKERKKLDKVGKDETLKYIWEQASWVQDFFLSEDEYTKWMVRSPIKPKSDFLFRKKILSTEEKKMSSYDIWLKYGYSMLGLLMGRSLIGREDL